MAENAKSAGKEKTRDFVSAVGRRREAVARVRVYSKIPNLKESKIKKGDIIVNGRNISEYFSGEVAKAAYEKPLKVANTLGKYAITARVVGGGMQSQLGAFILGVSRVFASMDESIKPSLRKNSLLTRDSRVRERRKVGMGGKARRKKQSPKR